MVYMRRLSARNSLRGQMIGWMPLIGLKTAGNFRGVYTGCPVLSGAPFAAHRSRTAGLKNTLISIAGDTQKECTMAQIRLMSASLKMESLNILSSFLEVLIFLFRIVCRKISQIFRGRNLFMKKSWKKLIRDSTESGKLMKPGSIPLTNTVKIRDGWKQRLLGSLI